MFSSEKAVKKNLYSGKSNFKWFHRDFGLVEVEKKRLANEFENFSMEFNVWKQHKSVSDLIAALTDLHVTFWDALNHVDLLITATTKSSKYYHKQSQKS